MEESVLMKLWDRGIISYGDKHKEAKGVEVHMNYGSMVYK